LSRRYYSHRASRLHRWTLCALFRLNPRTYRHRREMLAPFLQRLIGIEPRRSNYRHYQDYKPDRSSLPNRPPPVRPHTRRPLTLAERHAEAYRRRETLPPPPADHPREFALPRKSQTRPTASIRTKPHGNQKFQPIPPPTGKAPYRLALDSILPPEQIAAMQQAGRILMHVVGDTGGVKSPESQRIVSMAMESHFNFPDITLRPAFFYHLGDVVYYYGEPTEYYPQFYDPYEHYPAPILGIPGNHDGDLGENSPPSLTAFVNNFCAPYPHISEDAGEATRDTMTQPNVYFTLEAPFVTMIGLYSNVPEGGSIDDAQVRWFVDELRAAPHDKALIVTVHHPPYSGDSHHSGSRYIGELLDAAFQESGRIADLVLSAHVHNYQRFTRTFGERQLPYIVAGGGGYWHLHYMAKQPNGESMQAPFQMPDGPLLEDFCDDRHGFLRLMVTPQIISGEYFACSRPQESWRKPPDRADGFILNWQTHRITRGTALR